jgi:phage terminase large subunit-like protein
MSDIQKLQELERLYEQLNRHRKYNWLQWYEPVPKQKEFHDLGATHRQRMLMAANQVGKTLSAGAEVAMHLTGRYPEWWDGARWDRPTHWWASGVTSESTRDNPQRILLGRERNFGTGTIPYNALATKPSMARGVPDAVNSISVLHTSGGVSTLKFKSYDQGREKWQGETLDGIWFDEEPPADIYNEGITRLNRNRGHAMLTFTPLLGMTEVVQLFLEPEANDPGRKLRSMVHMTLEDATFYSAQEREEIASQYGEAMREARVKGLPMFGEGLIYSVHDDSIAVDPFPIPDHFKRIVGLDHGVGHPSALVWIAYDADQDVVYVYDCWKQANTTISERADAYRQRGDWIPVAWPHDVARRDQGVTGKPFAQLYEEKGLNMLPESAALDPDKRGPQSTEAIIEFVLDRMRTGRFKVFRNLSAWFSEKNRYHRKEGQVVRENDDLMSATHYAVMELRSARPYRPEVPRQDRAVDYDPLGSYVDPSGKAWI